MNPAEPAINRLAPPDSIERASFVQIKSTEIGNLLTREISKVAHVRYDIGAIVCQLMNAEASYGDGLVDEVASTVGRDPDTLYDYGRVASVWTRAQFEELIRRKNANGVALSFSHFVELARKDGKGSEGLIPEQRAELLALAQTENLSVRALAKKVRERLRSVPGTPRNPSVVAELSKAARRFISQTTGLSELVERVAKTGVADRDAEQLNLTIANVERTQSACAELLLRLRALPLTPHAEAAA